MRQKSISLLAAFLTICSAAGVNAQKIVVVDKDGNAVPYASVMTADAARGGQVLPLGRVRGRPEGDT